MNKKLYTSLSLSKWLYENGCRLESSTFWVEEDGEWELEDKEYWETVDGEWGSCRSIRTKDKCECSYCEDGDTNDSRNVIGIRAYDILNDICIKYAKQFFGAESEGDRDLSDAHTMVVYMAIKNGDKKGAEEYIKENCLFNKK